MNSLRRTSTFGSAFAIVFAATLAGCATGVDTDEDAVVGTQAAALSNEGVDIPDPPSPDVKADLKIVDLNRTFTSAPPNYSIGRLGVRIANAGNYGSPSVWVSVEQCFIGYSGKRHCIYEGSVLAPALQAGGATWAYVPFDGCKRSNTDPDAWDEVRRCMLNKDWRVTVDSTNKVVESNESNNTYGG